MDLGRLGGRGRLGDLRGGRWLVVHPAAAASAAGAASPAAGATAPAAGTASPAASLLLIRLNRVGRLFLPGARASRWHRLVPRRLRHVPGSPRDGL